MELSTHSVVSEVCIDEMCVPLASYPGHMGPLFLLPCGLGMRFMLMKSTHTARYAVLAYSTYTHFAKQAYKVLDWTKGRY